MEVEEQRDNKVGSFVLFSRLVSFALSDSLIALKRVEGGDKHLSKITETNEHTLNFFTVY